MIALLKWSMAALLAGNGADAVSSWGRPELNPVLGRQFDGRSVAIKFGVTGAVIATEAILTRRHKDLSKPLAITNFVGAVALTSIAIHNTR